ncbi:MAG: hypothetical protein NW208_00965 [Bryobacter sp.]|nr:hypothetical protein [Bryobacter sp.]
MNIFTVVKHLGLVLVLAAGLAAQESYEGRPATRLANDKIELLTVDKGGAFASLRLLDDARKVNPMWEPGRMVREAGGTPRFGDSMGHFVCVDGFGPSSADEKKAGLEAHGEAHRLPWEKLGLVREGAKQTLRYRVTLPVVQETFRRQMELVDGEQVVYVESELENLLGFDRPVNWAEHATIGAPFLAPDITVVDASVGRCETRPHDKRPNNRTLAPGVEFTYPIAPRQDGSLRNLRTVPNPPNSMDHVGCLMDPNQEHGWVTAINTKERLMIGYLFRRAEYPWLQEWLNFPPSGQLSRGLEFGTQPYDVSRRDAISRGTMFGVPTYRWLPAKGKIGSRFLMFWTRVPEGMDRVESVEWKAGSLSVKGAGRTVVLPASLGL